MIPAEYYSLVYTIIVILFAIPILNRYMNGIDIYSCHRLKEPMWYSLLFTILIVLFVGFRPNSDVFADGPGYWSAIITHKYEHLTYEDVSYQFATKWLMSFMSSNNFSPRLGFLILTSVVYGGAYIAMRKMFPSDTLLAMVLFCGTFSVFAGAVNGIKNGMACSMFLCAIAYKDQWVKCVMFLMLSIGFHHSMQLSLGAFIMCLFCKKTNYYYIFWVAALFVAMAHITFFQTLLANYTDEHGARYLLAEEDDIDVWGFRPDFILYSTAPLFLGLWAKSKMFIDGTKYQFSLNVYLVMNAIWLLCMYAAFSNRFAALSWMLFPILLLDPLINLRISNNQHKVLVWFVIGQLAFTFFMEIVYIVRYR